MEKATPTCKKHRHAVWQPATTDSHRRRKAGLKDSWPECENARILPETGKLAEYAGTNIKMAKKDSHIAAMADAKTDTAQSAKQLSETLSAADLKTARQSAMTAEQMSRIALKPISGEGLDTAPKTASPETASAQLVAANTLLPAGSHLIRAHRVRLNRRWLAVQCQIPSPICWI